MTVHTLAGLRPTPLASYLAGLGLIRVLGEQADPALTAWWTDGLVLDTTVDDITGWLVEQYVPTPVLSPWNGGSGFGEKDTSQRQALTALLALPGPRLEPYREAHAVASAVAERAHRHGWDKPRLVRELRNHCPEPMLPWIDAAVVLASDQAYFPPLLGTGGNDGRLEFSHTFHKRLSEVLDPDPKAWKRSANHARDLLTGEQVERLEKAMIGQFDPGGAGGKGSSPFGAAESYANPWSYVLLIEGAMLFAATAARRHQHAAGRAAIPFTVTASPDGSGSGADGEASTARGEVWAPVWREPFSLAETKQLFAEARASWNGRPAQRAVEFYAATRTLGVARGVAGFVRYGLHQRNGLAFVAVPVEHVTVTDKPEVRLAARLEEWVSRVRRGELPAAVGRAVRRFDAAAMDFAREGGARPLARLLAAVTDLELAVGRSGRTRERVPVRVPPPAHEFLTVLAGLDLPELRVAAGIASCATRPDANAGHRSGRSMRQILLPVDPDRHWRDAPVVAGFGLRRLPEVLADVFAWRCRTAPDEPDVAAFRGSPTFRRGVRVPDADLHAFAAGRLRETELDLWLRACLALRWDGVAYEWADVEPPTTPVPLLGLLHPLANGLPTSPREADRDAPMLALSPDWAVQLRAGRAEAVHEQAVRRLRQAGWLAVPPLTAADVDGTAVAAALVPRCRRPQRMLRTLLAVPATSPTEVETPTDTEMPELAEEMT